MKLFKYLNYLIVTSFFTSLAFSQDSSESGSSESAAEASVTGSASAPSASAPGSIESSPVAAAFRGGMSLQQFKKFGGVKNLRSAYISGGVEGITDTIELLEKGLSLEDALKNVKNGTVDEAIAAQDAINNLPEGEFDEEAFQELSDALLSSLKAGDISKDIYGAAILIGTLQTYESSYQTAVVEAATLANSLLTDITITSSNTLPTTLTVDSLSSGYNVAFVHLLSKYGAIGSNGDSVIADILTGTLSDSLESDSGLLSKTSTSDYLNYLATYTGSASFGDIDATSSVLDIPVENISISPGANITVGSSGAESTIDVSSILPASAADHRNYRKVHVIGAAKDMTVSGDVTFTNTNDVEDHALVLAAADDFTASGTDITYTGSNLAIAAGGNDADSMYLTNSKITTGGNLAVGTLGTLNMSAVEINVGNANSATSDPDNVYLYANELIQVNNLSFSGSRLDDVYMEAITVNLKDVAFPSTADVILKSRDGSKHFDTWSSPVVGGVNLTNVSHGGTVLTDAHFDGVAGHHDSSIRLPNGTPAVKIRKQY